MSKKIKKVIILVDMEGIAGVFDKLQCKPLSSEWKEARFLVNADVSAGIAGLKDAGVEEIHIKDMHSTGFNLIPSLLPEDNVFLQQGHNWYPIPLLGTIPEADLAIMIGWHGTPEQKEAFSPHIFHKDIDWVKIDSNAVGEIEIMAALMAEADIPVGMLSADHISCKKVMENMPWILNVEIPKRFIDSKEMANIHRRIRNNARQAVEKADSFPLYSKGPYFMESSIRGRVRRGYFPSAGSILATLLKQSVFRGIPGPMIPGILHSYSWFAYWNNFINR